MEQKEIYTMRELFDSLEITMTELVKRSGISDVTLGKIRSGKSARRDTINTLLRIFSDIYGIKFSTSNVRGIMIQGKPISNASEKIEKQPILSPMQTSEKAPKRDYKPRDTELPEDSVLASAFAEAHSVNRKTFEGHYKTGLGRKEKEKAVVSDRPKPGREKETEYYLTREQQGKVLDFWLNHQVKFALCEDESCVCHELA